MTAARGHRCRVGRGERVARRRSHPQHLARAERVAPAGGQHERGPARREGPLDALDDVGEQDGEGKVAYQGLRQLVEALGLLRPVIGLLAQALELGHHLGYDEDDGRVHPQRDPVLGRVHREGVVGREEEPVVDQEPGNGPDGAGPEPADDGAHQRGQHEDQGRHRDAEMRAEGEQDDEQDAEAGQGDDNAQNRTLVRSPRSQAALHHVSHSFPSSGVVPAIECTDAIGRPSERRSR